MKTKRVLTINHFRSLLMDGVEDLLRVMESGQIELVSTPANNLGDLIQEIKKLKPNVIIMEEVSTFFKPMDLVISVLGYQSVRLIVLNSHYSKMDIYDKRECIISKSDHIIEALKF